MAYAPMRLDAQMERIYRSVRLVNGVGDSGRGEFCVLSLLAFLLGESHSDRPSCVSPLIRRFAIEINDGMLDSARQCLKPFVPRLIGTKDDADDARAQLLARYAQAVLVPRIRRDFPDVVTQDGSQARRRDRRKQHLRKLIRGMPCRSSEAVYSGGSRCREELAASVAQLLVHCGQMSSPDEIPWYWLQAINLLDQLCDVRSPPSSKVWTVVPKMEAWGDHCAGHLIPQPKNSHEQGERTPLHSLVVVEG